MGGCKRASAGSDSWPLRAPAVSSMGGITGWSESWMGCWCPPGPSLREAGNRKTLTQGQTEWTGIRYRLTYVRQIEVFASPGIQTKHTAGGGRAPASGDNNIRQNRVPKDVPPHDEADGLRAMIYLRPVRSDREPRQSFAHASIATLDQLDALSGGQLAVQRIRSPGPVRRTAEQMHISCAAPGRALKP